MSNPKLYKLTFEFDLVVQAHDEDEAIRFADDTLRNYDFQSDLPQCASLTEYPEEVTSENDLPVGWDEKCIPYGYRDPKNPDRTVGEILKKG